jgi:hypothetical protein
MLIRYGASVTLQLKTINYRGGVVRFRIPADWAEEYGEDGGGMFYKPGDNTGTLRLNIITAKAPPAQPVSSHTSHDFLSTDAAKYGQPVVPLRDGVAMLQYDEESEERAHRIKLRIWRIAQAIPPDHIRHAMFTYALLAADFDQPQFKEELGLLDTELRACELAPALGQTPAPKKPWWRPW